MVIQNLKTFVVANPPPHFGGRYFIFLKLITDNGIEGFSCQKCIPSYIRMHTQTRAQESYIFLFSPLVLGYLSCFSKQLNLRLSLCIAETTRPRPIPLPLEGEDSHYFAAAILVRFLIRGPYS